MRGKQSPMLFVFALALAAAANLGGCTITLAPSDGNDTTAPVPTPTTISVRIVNQTSHPLDPQIYLAPAGTAADALFTPDHKRTDFGVGKLGVLLPLGDVTLTITCGELGVFGTQGGIFGEDLANPDGHGRQVVLEENKNVQCGDSVTFTFSAQGSTLITSYTVSQAGP